LDTRIKILDWSAAERLILERPHRIVTGHFDPLLAAQARRLTEIARDGSPLMVIVTDPPEPLLPAHARAELVAALGAVQCVAVAPKTGLDELLALMPKDTVWREESDDIRTAAEFARRVRERRAGQG